MRHAMHRASITPAFLRRLAAAHGSGASPPCSSGDAMMPPDDTAVPAILPETPAAGSAKFTVPLPAGALPEDVRHWFDLETIVDLPPPVASFDDAADAAAQYRRASRSENTRRAYRSAVARFCDWCAMHGRTALPASPETVAAFLAAEAPAAPSGRASRTSRRNARPRS